MSEQHWYTLVRFRDHPGRLTGVSQAKTVLDAWTLQTRWQQAFPADTCVVFDPANRPIQGAALVEAARQQSDGSPPV